MSVKESINKKLTAALLPTHLEVINESHQHHVPANSETHFKVIIVSEKFVGNRLLQRHRMINQTLADEFAAGLHALTMHTYTSEEWQKIEQVPQSPKCKG